MHELNINQAQVVGLIGKSKGSVSMYLSNQVVPPSKAQEEIALALGLAPDYFEQDEERERKLIKNAGAISTISVADVASLMHMGVSTIRLGLQQGVFPWGYAVKTSENRWSYFINAKRFADIEGVVIKSD
nr:MAG TPA: LAMBDA REPRESSOR (TRIPLE MUTANT)/DNA COMPLEX-DNA COMPLEX, DOUBLE HELIX, TRANSCRIPTION-DNA.1A [Caudoviricetes sp.]